MIQKLIRKAHTGLGLGALLCLLLEYGFELGPIATRILHGADLLITVLFAGTILFSGWIAASRRTYAKDHWLELGLIAFLLLLTVFSLSSAFRSMLSLLEFTSRRNFFITVAKIYLVLSLLLELARAYEGIARLRIRPVYWIPLSFAALIAVGTFSLLLPRAGAPSARPISFLDALFTATSAACVTGLTVRDTGMDFSTLGHAIIMLVIQVGGLGLVTIIAFLSLLQKRGLGMRQLVLFRETASLQTVGHLGRFLTYVLVVTVVAEVTGAFLLYHTWNESSLGAASRLHWSLFHAVSAFCNAGFGLKSNNLVDYAAATRLNATIITLIVIGGLGFPVIVNLLRLRLSIFTPFHRLRWLRRWEAEDTFHRLTLHSRIVLTTSTALIVIGALLFLIFERRNTLEAYSSRDCLLISVFQSVTARTAGFNTVDVDRLQISTQTILMALMIVGASPVSTGGGIKTISLVILFATIVSLLRNREPVEIYRRTVPRTMVNTAISVTVLYFTILFGLATLLSITDPDVPYRKIVFETISAMSTVGLSTGITPALSPAGKLLLCFAMIIGRLGPLVILFSVAGRTEGRRYQYPEENITVS